MDTVPSSPGSVGKKRTATQGTAGDRCSAPLIETLVQAKFKWRYFPCVAVLKCQGIPGARKEPVVSIALDGYVVETYPGVQKVALGVENDHIRDQRSQVFSVAQNRNWW